MVDVMALRATMRASTRRDRGTTFAMACLILMATFVAVSIPAIIEQITDTTAQYRAGLLSGPSRDLTAVIGTTAVTGDGQDMLAVDDATSISEIIAPSLQIVTDAYDSFPAHARETLGKPELSVVAETYPIEVPEDSLIRSSQLSLAYWVSLEDHITLVEGELPGANSSTVEVMVSRSSAEWFEWEVGEIRAQPHGTFTLVGIFEAQNPEDDHWDHRPGAIEPLVNDDFNSGLTVTVQGFVGPDGPNIIRNGFTMRVWYPVTIDAITQPTLTAAQMRRIGSQATEVMYSEMRFTSELADTLDTAEQDARDLITTVTYLVTVPLFTIAFVYVILSARLRNFHAATMKILQARGATTWQLQRIAIVRLARIAVPMTTLGMAMAVIGRANWASTGLYEASGTDLVATFGILLFALSPALGVGAGRKNVSLWWGIVAPVIALPGVAALVTGAIHPSDPLGALTSVFTALTVVWIGTLTTLTVVRGIAITRRRNSAAVYLAKSRVTRDPTLATQVALVICVVAGLSSASLAAQDYRTSITHDVSARVGADVKVSGPRLTEDLQKELRDTPGIATVLPVTRVTPASTNVNGAQHNIDVYATDLATANIIGLSLPTQLDPHDEQQAVISPSLAHDIAGQSVATVTLNIASSAGAIHLPTAHTADYFPGIADGARWVVADRSAFPEPDTIGSPTIALITLDNGADLDEVTSHVSSLLPTARLDTRTDTYSAVTQEPTNKWAAISAGAAITITVIVGLATYTSLTSVTQNRRAALRNVLQICHIPTTLASRADRAAFTLWAIPSLVLGLAAGGALTALAHVTTTLIAP